ncbi:MAG: hypothetical protein MHMPM18_003787 [Marteilia pararefringens]
MDECCELEDSVEQSDVHDVEASCSDDFCVGTSRDEDKRNNLELEAINGDNHCSLCDACCQEEILGKYQELPKNQISNNSQHNINDNFDEKDNKVRELKPDEKEKCSEKKKDKSNLKKKSYLKRFANKFMGQNKNLH